jgi:hypothetical protein
MNNLNVGVLVSSVLATAGLGVYVYMNNNNNIITEYLHSEEAVHDEDLSNENESDHIIKSNKKVLTVKSKRRTNKTSGTRRKRY